MYVGLPYLLTCLFSLTFHLTQEPDDRNAGGDDIWQYVVFLASIPLISLRFLWLPSRIHGNILGCTLWFICSRWLVSEASPIFYLAEVAMESLFLLIWVFHFEWSISVPSPFSPFLFFFLLQTSCLLTISPGYVIRVPNPAGSHGGHTQSH